MQSGDKQMYHTALKLREAQEFIQAFHRHSPPLKRHMFSIGVSSHQGWGGKLLGVATVDRCSSAWSKRYDHVELRRLCIRPDAKKNTASFLIGKAKDACFAMGYRVIVTYTKPNECGASLKASGFWLQKARWVKGKPEHDRGLLQWVAVRDRQPDAEERAWTKQTLEQIKQDVNK